MKIVKAFIPSKTKEFSKIVTRLNLLGIPVQRTKTGGIIIISEDCGAVDVQATLRKVSPTFLADVQNIADANGISTRDVPERILLPSISTKTKNKSNEKIENYSETPQAINSNAFESIPENECIVDESKER